jgi:hypothetical protein
MPASDAVDNEAMEQTSMPLNVISALTQLGVNPLRHAHARVPSRRWTFPTRRGLVADEIGRPRRVQGFRRYSDVSAASITRAPEGGETGVLWPDPADEATLKAIAEPANSARCAGVSSPARARRPQRRRIACGLQYT